MKILPGKLIAITLALSFLTTLVPIIASAAASKSGTMPCCVGKEAGHCDSGIAAKPIPPPQSEPLCGLETAQPDDAITIIAEPYTKSHHPSSRNAESLSAETSQRAVESLTLEQSCNMDDCACTIGSVRQQKRERAAGGAYTRKYSPSEVLSRSQDSAIFFSANEDWARISPRGPPVALL
jgi:hypothetical protein